MGIEADWIAPIGDFELNWLENGDEWLQKMREISGYSGYVGYTEEGFTGRPVVIELRPDGSQPGNPRVLLIPDGGDTVTVALAGTFPEVDNGTKAHWADIAQQATSALQIPATTYKWVALIGEKPSQSAGRTIKLAEASQALGMRLIPSDTALWEPVINTVSSLSMETVSVSFPISVQGKSTARTWQHARKQASGELSRLAALLALDWNIDIDVRERPSLVQNWPPVSTPQSPYWAKEIFESPPEITEFTTVAVPDWIGDARRKFTKNKKLESAVAIHMEGIRISENHPSLALVSFVSCIEAISLMIYREEKCSTCSGHMRIAVKFRETLKRVTTDAEANYLHRVYNDRSRTVHGGRLHGGELGLGIRDFGVSSSPETEFAWEIVRRMKSASRKLLLLALKNQLPQSRIHLE
ncbi:hypothetical protein OG402_23320 [Streptomyces anulatus]|uniref:hypothetical protein n=1 Tax=Streptomyces anulatus TaxID=1892 RepID=UPI0022508506|nr:hypothetical protein [Streptomyces anulatus]MCX4520526.1 hypothetical protein [Streptomyces anulatus]MCX4603395.1 hypothetical protein [Streptomyces anulatus]